MQVWFRYFLGTPQRFIRTLVAVAIAWCLFDPAAFAQALSNAVWEFLNALQPLLGPVIQLLVLGLAVKVMFRIGSGKK